MTFCVTQVTFFVTTKTPPLEGRAPHDRQGMPWLDRGLSPFGHRLWPDRLGGHALHDRTNGPRHSTDISSRTRGAHPSANLAFGLFPNCPRWAKSVWAGAPRRVGLRTTAKESPWLHRGIPPLATASCSTPSEDPARYDPQANGLGMRPTHLHGRAERIPPQTIFGPTNIPCAFPARPHARGWPLGGSGSARPPRKALARPWHSASGNRLLLNRIACSAFARPQFKALRLSSRLFLRPLTPARSTADDALRGKSTS